MKRDVLPAAHTSSALPVQPISQDVLAEKYLKDGEKTEAELFARVARALASVEKPEIRDEWEAKFLGNLHAGALVHLQFEFTPLRHLTAAGISRAKEQYFFHSDFIMSILSAIWYNSR